MHCISVMYHDLEDNVSICLKYLQYVELIWLPYLSGFLHVIFSSRLSVTPRKEKLDTLSISMLSILILVSVIHFVHYQMSSTSLFI